ncbi:MAG: hypothetical protein GX100_02875 [candidate division WS1 bacterium]|nr:hypothetical protein [candidate division WS1 bacterium]
MQVSEARRIGRSRRYQVLVDGQVVLEADEEVIAQFGLAPGRMLGEDTISEAQRADQALLAARAALRLLRFRARSSQELYRALRARKFSTEVVELTLERLEQAGLVNDQELSASLARQLRERRMGTHLVRQKMLQIGLDRELAEATLSALGEEGELERATAVADKYLARPATGPSARLRGRLYQHLRRRGFADHICREVVEQTVPESE